MEQKDKTKKNNMYHRGVWSFAEAFYQISIISNNPREAMHHCAELIFAGPRSNLDINDLRALLEHNGVLETFEVAVNANEENRMEQLIEQMRMHLDKYGHLKSVLALFYQTKDSYMKMEELNAFSSLYKSYTDNVDFCWSTDINEQCTEPILSATVLVMYEPQRDSIQRAGRKSLAMTNDKTNQNYNWSHRHDYPIEEIWNTYQVLAEFISPRLQTFKDHDKHGYCSVFRDMNEWNQAIQKMIDAFELLRDKDDKGTYTEEEDETIRQGLELFGKYFRYLWD